MVDKSELNKGAVALRYDMEAGGAPHVTAKGRGLIAEQILQIAREHNANTLLHLCAQHAHLRKYSRDIRSFDHRLNTPKPPHNSIEP